MSESMPIVANTAAAAGQSREASSTSSTEGKATDVESTDSNGGFPKLLKAQLKSTKSDSDQDSTATSNPKSDTGNDSPPDMANPAQAGMIPLEIFKIHNNAATSLQASGEGTAAKPLTAVNLTGTNTNAVNGVTSLALNASGSAGANADDTPLDMDEALMTRQQQQLIQAATNSKGGPRFDSLLKQQGGTGTEAAGQPPLPASPAHNNTFNLAALPAGPLVKADAPPGQLPPALNVPPQHPGWNQAMGDRLQWMVGHHLQSASIRLDPPELGSLNVHIQLHKDHASVTFTAPSQQVRDALESAVPRLREMMTNIGLSLGDVNVSQQSFGQGQQANENAGSAHSFTSDEGESDRLEAIAPIAPRRGIGMLDAYA